MTPRSLLAPARLARRPVLATQSDARLVDLVRAGFEPAFETIVARYRRPLLRHVSRILPPERAEDAVQQAFVNAYEAMLRDESELSLRPWLYRIAHNVAVNALRDPGPRHDTLHEGIDGVERPDQALERTQGLRDVVAAVQALPERQRDAIVLRELEGRSYEEIAGELGVTNGAVRQLLNRARTSLRAAATAVTPVGLVTRVPWAGPAEPVAARVAELCGAGGAGAGAAAAKVCATALVTGAVVGGAAVVPNGGDHARPGPSGAGEAQAAQREQAGLVGAAGEQGGHERGALDRERSGAGGGGGEGGRGGAGERRGGEGERGGGQGERGGGQSGRADDERGRGGDGDDDRGRRAAEQQDGGDDRDDDADERSTAPRRRGGDEDDGRRTAGRGEEDEADRDADGDGEGERSGDEGSSTEGDEEPDSANSGSEATAGEANHEPGSELSGSGSAGSGALEPAGYEVDSGSSGSGEQ
jgi:RNA polymerase sigma factor (sigma-70 family)